MEDPAEVEVADHDLPQARENDGAGGDQDGVGPPRPGGAQRRPGPVLPPERDHREERQREGDERTEHQYRALGAARPERQQSGDRHHQDEPEEAEPRLPLGGHRQCTGSITSSGAIGSSRIRRPVA
jgi:hypothetical protein